jgi:hypothetical protein
MCQQSSAISLAVLHCSSEEEGYRPFLIEKIMREVGVQ